MVQKLRPPLRKGTGMWRSGAWMFYHPRRLSLALSVRLDESHAIRRVSHFTVSLDTPHTSIFRAISALLSIKCRRGST